MSAEIDVYPPLHSTISETNNKMSRSDGWMDGRTDGRREKSLSPSSDTHTHTKFAEGKMMAGLIYFRNGHVIKHLGDSAPLMCLSRHKVRAKYIALCQASYKRNGYICHLR